MRSRLTAATAVAATALVVAGAAAARTQTTAPPPVVSVRVTITDSRIALSQKSAVRGAFVRFILINVGSKPHTFALGNAKRQTGVQTGFAKLLKPNQQRVLLLFLDYRGTLPYRAPLPADRAKAAMHGTFTIT